MPSQSLIQVDTITDLKLQPVDATVKVFVQAKLILGDGLGGFYYWDAASTLNEDMIFMNVVTSSLSSAGRWIRMFQRSRTLSQGVLVSNGNVKTLYAPGTTLANGTATCSLNDAAGNAIFSEVWENRSYCTTPVSAPADAVQSYISAFSASSTTHAYYKVNAITVLAATVLGPLVNVGAGIKVQFIITGV